MVERFLREERLPVNDAIEVDEIPALVHLVAEGLGVALVPLVEAHLPLPNDVHAMSLGKSTFYRETGLLQRRVSDCPPIVVHFARILKDCAEVTTQSSMPVRTHPIRKHAKRTSA
jgi:DNA-binding transcriptional LysR family regulator